MATRYKLVNHLVKGERAWLERIMGKEWNRDLWGTETRAMLLELQKANNQIRKKVFERTLEGRIQVTRLNGQVHNPKVADILQHVFYHSETHRGRLASFCARAGLQYPVTDYMTYCIGRKL